MGKSLILVVSNCLLRIVDDSGASEETNIDLIAIYGFKYELVQFLRERAKSRIQKEMFRFVVHFLKLYTKRCSMRMKLDILQENSK